MSSIDQSVGRLVLRVEGNLWVAYYGAPHSMKDPIFLGSIQMRFVQETHHKAAFLDLMREGVSAMLEETIGTRPTWGEGERLSDHERVGRA